jgi:hypothetical protein
MRLRISIDKAQRGILLLTKYLQREIPQIVPYLNGVIHVEVDGYWWVIHPDRTYLLCPLEEI